MPTNVGSYYLNFIKSDFESGNTVIALIRQDGTEVNGGGYTRKNIGSLTASSDQDYYILSNSSTILFNVASSDWAPPSNPIVKVAIYFTSGSSTNLVATSDLPVSLVVLQGDQVKFNPGDFKIKIPKVVT